MNLLQIKQARINGNRAAFKQRRILGRRSLYGHNTIGGYTRDLRKSDLLTIDIHGGSNVAYILQGPLHY